MGRVLSRAWWLAALLCQVATAQTPQFSGKTLDDRAYTLAAQRGRVVMVVLWRTECAVCLSKMPELRANAQGWKASPSTW